LPFVRVTVGWPVSSRPAPAIPIWALFPSAATDTSWKNGSGALCGKVPPTATAWQTPFVEIAAPVCGDAGEVEVDVVEVPVVVAVGSVGVVEVTGAVSVVGAVVGAVVGGSGSVVAVGVVAVGVVPAGPLAPGLL